MRHYASLALNANLVSSFNFDDESANSNSLKITPQVGDIPIRPHESQTGS